MTSRVWERSFSLIIGDDVSMSRGRGLAWSLRESNAHNQNVSVPAAAAMLWSAVLSCVCGRSVSLISDGGWNQGSRMQLKVVKCTSARGRSTDFLVWFVCDVACL